MATTTNYSWSTPDDTDLVKDGAAAIRTLGSSADTTTKNLNPQTTTGALAFRSATNNVNTALPIGTAGQVLQVNSGATAPEWGSPPSGSMTQLATGTLSGATISLTSIDQGYEDLYLILNEYQVSDNTSTPLVAVNGNALSTIHGIAWSGNSAGTNTFSGIRLTGNRTVRTGVFDNNAYVYFFNYTTATRKAMNAGGTYFDGSSEDYNFGAFSGGNRTAAAITEINIKLNSTFTYDAGTYILYGVK